MSHRYLTPLLASEALTRGLGDSEARKMLSAVKALPEKAEVSLQCTREVETLSNRLVRARNMLFLGRGLLFPVALEGALKLKEVSYIHAEGYPVAEMKHGPIALVDEDMPVAVLACNDGNLSKIASNLEEIKGIDIYDRFLYMK